MHTLLHHILRLLIEHLERIHARVLTLLEALVQIEVLQGRLLLEALRSLIGLRRSYRWEELIKEGVVCLLRQFLTTQRDCRSIERCLAEERLTDRRVFLDCCSRGHGVLLASHDGEVTI